MKLNHMLVTRFITACGSRLFVDDGGFAYEQRHQAARLANQLGNSLISGKESFKQRVFTNRIIRSLYALQFERWLQRTPKITTEGRNSFHLKVTNGS
jgi:hypothetical protein